MDKVLQHLLDCYDTGSSCENVSPQTLSRLLSNGFIKPVYHITPLGRRFFGETPVDLDLLKTISETELWEPQDTDELLKVKRLEQRGFAMRLLGTPADYPYAVTNEGREALKNGAT